MEMRLQEKDIRDLELEVKEGETLTLNMSSFASFPSAKIIVNVHRDSKFEGAFADFSQGKGKISIQVNLLEEGAVGFFHSAVLSSSNSDKTLDINIAHLAPHTEGLAESHGICEDHSRLFFFGASSIIKGAKQSSTRQAAKIMVFDEDCRGRCDPVLVIDENDVQASHAAVLGKLNEAHLFYLLSRGIELKEAKRLMTQGYLRPIADYFDNETKMKILSCIEGGN